ncbi:MAG TPA: histidine phosphatase family protein [Sphingomonas sp.]|nr:histidine phosphatase family protein [Sphingomonas sp.]
MTTLFLVRHGESIWHAENRYAGSSDIALTSNGIRQAEALREWADARRPARVVSSPLLRARETATPAARAAGVELEVVPELTESDFGIAEGRTLAEMRSDWPEATAAFVEDPGANPWPGGESPMAAAARGAAALRAIAAGGGPVLVVAHNTLLRLSLCNLLGIPPGSYRRALPQLRNVAINEIRFADGVAGLVSLNVPVDIPGKNR